MLPNDSDDTKANEGNEEMTADDLIPRLANLGTPVSSRTSFIRAHRCDPWSNLTLVAAISRAGNCVALAA
jgi:hypothetical protein